MAETTHLGLQLVNSTEWATTYFKDYIEAMSGVGDTSNLAKIDAAVAALQEAVTDIPSPITGTSEQVTAKEDIAKGNVVRVEDANAYLATTATTASSYRLAIAENDIASGSTGVVTVIACVDHNTELTATDIAFDASSTTMTAANVQSAITELFQDVDDGKTLVASAITDKGITTSEDATFQQMAENISNIETGSDTSDATAAAADLRQGKIAYTADGKIIGSMPDVSMAAVSAQVDSASGQLTVTKTQSESGYVKQGTTTESTQLATQTATTYTPGTSDQTISKYRWLTGDQTIKGDTNLVASNIKSGVSIFGVAGSLEADTKQTATITVRCFTTDALYLMYQVASGDFDAVYMEDGDKTTITTYVGAWIFGCIDGGSSMAYNFTGMTRVGPGDTCVVQVTATSGTVYYGDA